MPVDSARSPQKNEISAFGASANNPDVSGEAARHARHKGSAPRHSMTIDEGRTLRTTGN